MRLNIYFGMGLAKQPVLIHCRPEKKGSDYIVIIPLIVVNTCIGMVQVQQAAQKLGSRQELKEVESFVITLVILTVLFIGMGLAWKTALFH